MKTIAIATLVFISLSRIALAADAAGGDKFAVAVGVDGSGVGEHLLGEVALAPAWSLGLKLGQEQYRNTAKTLTSESTTEEMVYGKYTQNVTKNVDLYQQLGFGRVQTPSDASLAGYYTLDAETGVKLTTGSMFTAFGLGLKDNLIAAPVKIGVQTVASQYTVYPTVSIGTTF